MSKEDKKQKVFWFPVDLCEKMTEDAKAKGFTSEASYVIEAIKKEIEGKKEKDIQSMRTILTAYDGTCIKCKEHIEKGSWALYGKGIGLVCLDCYIQKLGDKTLVAKYLKNRELERVKNVLSDEADRLASKVESYRSVEKLDALIQEQNKTVDLVKQYLTEKIGTPDEKKALEEILQQKGITEKIIWDMEKFVRDYLKNRKWIKKSQKQREQEQEGEYAQ